MKDPETVRRWIFHLVGFDDECATYFEPGGVDEYVFTGTWSEAQAKSDELDQEFENQLGALVACVEIESLGRVRCEMP